MNQETSIRTKIFKNIYCKNVSLNIIHINILFFLSLQKNKYVLKMVKTYKNMIKILHIIIEKHCLIWTVDLFSKKDAHVNGI